MSTGQPKRRVMGPARDDLAFEGPPRPPSSPPPSPPPSVIGPPRPPSSSPSSSLPSPPPVVFEGPARPPSSSSPSVEGPARPPSPSVPRPPSSTPASSSPSPSSPKKRRVMGPVFDPTDTKDTPPSPPSPPLPPSDFIIGPPRPSASLSAEREEEERERRASEWERVKASGPAKVIQREEWMTELPPERNPGTVLTNRQFSRKEEKTGRGDASIWTDSPADRERKKQKVGETKAQLKDVAARDYDAVKDEKNLRIMEQYNKKFRAKSLAEEHQEMLKKKQENAKPEDQPLWKPFDRDTDLSNRTADPNTTKKIIENSQNLNGRFGAASGKRFL